MAVVLPEEIERHIFELTARSNPETKPALLLVAKYVSHWISAIAFEIVIAGIGRDVGLYTTEPSATRIEQYGIYTRHLLLGLGCAGDDLQLYLRFCPNIVNLCVWKNYRFNPEILGMIKKLPLVRVSIHINSLYDSDGLSESDDMDQLCEGLSCFPEVTHFDFASRVPFHLASCVQYMPNLTYLSIFNNLFQYDEDWGRTFENIFELCPKLKVIVPLSQERTARDYEADEDEDGPGWGGKVISCTVKDYVEDWKRGALGEADLWVFATEQIETRLKPRLAVPMDPTDS